MLTSADESATRAGRLFYTFILKQHKSVWHFSKQTTTMEKKNDMKVSTTELYKYDMTYKKIQTENKEIHS